jgi:hypothetical protein
MVDANFVLNLVNTVGILVGITVAIMEIRASRKERRNQFNDALTQVNLSHESVRSYVSFLNMDFSTFE